MKGIVSPDDWEEMKEDIQYDYIFDNHFTELKETEMLTERLNAVNMVEPFLGKYYSVDYVRRQILKQTEDEIEEIDAQIEKEKEMGIIQDPMAAMDAMGGEEGEMPPEGDGAGSGGSDLDSAFSSMISPNDYGKGDI